jgi:hypothetical protein
MQTAAKVDQAAPRNPAAGSLTPFALSSAAASAAINLSFDAQTSAS